MTIVELWEEHCGKGKGCKSYYDIGLDVISGDYCGSNC